jgi:hypothetical protein
LANRPLFTDQKCPIGVFRAISFENHLNPFYFRGHLFDLGEIALSLKSGLFDAILVARWGMQVEYHPNRPLMSTLFKSSVVPTKIIDDEIRVNVRAEDIETGGYPGYYLLPFNCYDAVLIETSLQPVFMGQPEKCPYTDALRSRFPGAQF